MKKKSERKITDKTIHRDVCEFIALAINTLTRLEIHLMLLSKIFSDGNQSFTIEQEEHIRELMHAAAEEALRADRKNKEPQKLIRATRRLAAAIYKAGKPLRQASGRT